MKKIYNLLCAGLLALAALPAWAQYEFKDTPGAGTNGLGPYSQNFDALAGTKAIFNSNSTLLGVYARFTLSTFPGAEFESSSRIGTAAKLGPDDGSEGPNPSLVDADGTPHGASWYHFGTAGETDRALGGIASTTTAPGEGFIGVRLKNSSTKTIKNLEIRYAMEQWYNSSQTQAASVSVDYKINPGSPASANAVYLSGTGWTSISALNVAAPSTSTAIAPRNGNAATNRRILQTTLVDINLAAGQEIMVRWKYTFDSSRNGNGLSIDDVVITPQTNIFYSSAAANSNLDSKNSWGQNADGSGTSPSNFTGDNTVYYVRGNLPGVDRINGTWAVTGANSKIIVGTDAANPATLYVGSADDITGTVDVNAGSTLQIQKTTNTLALSALNRNSTVEYINTSTTTQSINSTTTTPYGNLKLTGSGPMSLAGSLLITNGLAFNPTNSASYLPVSLGNYDLTLQKGSAITGLNGVNTVFVTNGMGSLRQTVSNTGIGVTYPVASAAMGASATPAAVELYSPVVLTQPATATLNEDVFGVRVIDNVYSAFDANDVPATALNAEHQKQNVRKTWLVKEEVVGNSNVTMALQWHTAAEYTGTPASTSFDRTKAYIGHYIATAARPNPYYDKGQVAAATAGTTTNSFTVSRTGLTSFSPYVVSSDAVAPLPVALVAFEARRTGTQQVQCTWQTATEVNNSHFVVERSTTGEGFVAIGTLKGAGTTTSKQRYIFDDTKAPATTAYYRLRQVDLDGTASFSPVVAVQGCAGCAAEGAPMVVPNPGLGRFEVQTAGGAPQPLHGSVLNLLGQEVLKLTGETTFDLSAQPAGVYLVRLQGVAAPQRVLRVVKQ